MRKRNRAYNEWDFEGWFEDAREAMRSVPMTTSSMVRISNLNPHYTDERYRHAQTVYLAAGCKLSQGHSEYVQGAEYVYSDRLREWDWNKAEAARKAAREQYPDYDTAACLEAYLRLYYDKPHLALVHIMAGFNWATGYPYQVFGILLDGKPDLS